MTEQSSPSIDIVLDEARRKLDSQIGQLYALDTKSGIILGIAGVILTLLVTTLLGKQDTAVNSSLIKSALAPIFVSLILSFISITIRTYARPPKLERLRSRYISKDTKETKKFLIAALLNGVNNNEKLIGTRMRLVKYSYVALAIGVGILVVWVSSILYQ